MFYLTTTSVGKGEVILSYLISCVFFAVSVLKDSGESITDGAVMNFITVVAKVSFLQRSLQN